MQEVASHGGYINACVQYDTAALHLIFSSFHLTLLDIAEYFSKSYENEEVNSI